MRMLEVPKVHNLHSSVQNRACYSGFLKNDVRLRAQTAPTRVANPITVKPGQHPLLPLSSSGSAVLSSPGVGDGDAISGVSLLRVGEGTDVGVGVGKTGCVLVGVGVGVGGTLVAVGTAVGVLTAVGLAVGVGVGGTLVAVGLAVGSVTAVGGGVEPYSSAPTSGAGPTGRAWPSISSSHSPPVSATAWSMAELAPAARWRSPPTPSTNRESGTFSWFPARAAMAPSRSRRLWLIRLLVISTFVFGQRHSMDEEKGAPVETTVLCKTWVPHACSRQIPQSKPDSDANSVSLLAKIKLLRTIPSKWPT